MKKILPLVFLLLTYTPYAQSILRLQHLNVEDGLSQSSVYNIFQDDYGFMWFSTGDGLDRYDGKEFVVYKSLLNDTSSSLLTDRNINSSIFEDREHRMWMSLDAGICFFDSRHDLFRIPLRKYATALALDSNSLWCSLPQSGLYQVNVHDLQSRFYPFTDKWQASDREVCNIHNGVVTETGLWMVDDAGLLFFDKHTGKDKRILVDNKMNSVTLLHDGRLALCAEGGIYLYDIPGNRTELVPVLRKEGLLQQWKSLAEDITTHTLYIGASNSGTICRFNTDTHKYEFLDFQNGIVYCLYIDRSDNLWIGTEGNGVYKLDIKQPKFYCYTPNLPIGSGNLDGLMVKSIYTDDSGIIWIGSYNYGLIKYDPIMQKQTKVPLPFPSENKLISVIQKDSSGAMVVTAGSQILWLEPQNSKVIRRCNLPTEPASSPDAPDIYALTEWEKGHYLIATNIGLYSLNPEKYPVAAYFFPGLHLWSYCLQQAENNEIYVGRREGYTKVRVNNDTSIAITDTGFQNIAIRHFYKSRYTPILWMATEKGLIAYNETTKRFRVFDETSGLGNSYVYAILAENDSTLWISTNKGLSNVKLHYGDCTDIKAQFTNYTSRDGLQSSEFNTGAYFKCSDGTMMFGGIAGINWFKPSAIKANPFMADPAIAAIYVDDKLFAADTATYIRAITLPYNKNTISLSLRALEYTQPGQNQFAYKLDGLDKEWVYTTSDKVRYSNLPPGDYTFLLRVSNNDLTWNETPLKLSITILPPFWQTWWFRALAALLAILASYFIARIYVKQKVKVKTRELEKQQALYLERMRISKDVHDDLGSGLSKISLMAEIAQKRVSGDAAVSNDIRHISAVSKELVENMRDLIWVLNPENTTLDQLVARLREYCADYLENMPVEVNLDFPASVPALPISREAQRNVFLTVKEAINNSIKHAQAWKLDVVLKISADALNIKVTDNGRGFDAVHLKGSGNGLRNMKQRIELIGGVFGIISSGGTTISISIPLSHLSVNNTTLV